MAIDAKRILHVTTEVVEIVNETNLRELSMSRVLRGVRGYTCHGHDGFYPIVHLTNHSGGSPTAPFK